MKKLLVLAAVLAPSGMAMADPMSIHTNVSSANGVNVGNVASVGVNNFGALTQNVGVISGAVVQIDSHAVEQAGLSLSIGEDAFTIGSIVDSGVGGKAMIITVNSNNVSIQSKSISNVRVETTVNLADHNGAAGGADSETSLMKLPLKTIGEN
jgi:hypothetical protein